MLPHVNTGSSIRGDREAAGMSIRILADLVGVSASHLRNVEGGRRPCSTEMAAAIANVLGTDPERYSAPSRGGDDT